MIGRLRSGIVFSIMENDSPRQTRSRIASIDQSPALIPIARTPTLDRLWKKTLLARFW
jgi:hypothetical protein